MRNAGNAVAAQPVQAVAATGVPPPHPHHRAGAGIVGIHHQVAAPRPPSATALRGQHPMPAAAQHHPAHAVLHTPVEPISGPLMSPPGGGHINAVPQAQVEPLGGGVKRKRISDGPPLAAAPKTSQMSVPPPVSAAAAAATVHAAAVPQPPLKKANTTAICTDCGIKHASFGTKDDRKRRWCGACAKANGHPDAVNVNAKMCEDCGEKMASFGTQHDNKKRWCAGCAKAKQYTGAEYLGKRYMCEDCDKKRAAWGDGTNKKRRWCGSCVKANGHAATIIGVKLCEDCNDKQATFGTEHVKVRAMNCALPMAIHAANSSAASARPCCRSADGAAAARKPRPIRRCSISPAL